MISKSTLLDNIIIKIDDVGVPSNVKPNEITSSYKQFIDLLNRFIYWFQENFFYLRLETSAIIETLIKTNYSMFEKYLLSKHYLGDNNYIDFFKDSIYRIMISNFVKNIKYITEIMKLFKIKKIDIKNINDYTLEEVVKIKSLLSDIVFCSTSSFRCFNLFQDIEYFLNKKLKEIKLSKKDKERFIYNVINYYQVQYECAFEEYNKKEKYLKYFNNC